MVRAFGYCNDAFVPTAPGRLCRGRERWLEALPDTPQVTLARTVLSGAVFSDDSARDAKRGLQHSGLRLGRVLDSLFPRHAVLGYAEAGDPRALPSLRMLEEDWTRPLRGGLRYEPAVRWAAPVAAVDVDTWMLGEADGLAAPRADAFVVVSKAEVTPALAEGLFLLCGYAEAEDRPAHLYNPSALPILLEHARAVVLLHLDKHGPAPTIYTREPLGADEALVKLARQAEAFPVPFAIPPMLARWDRALFELRMEWDAARDGEFPVAPAEDTSGRWSGRRRRRYEVAEAAGEE